MILRRPLALLSALVLAGTAGAANTTLAWVFDPGAGLRTPVPACGDDAGLRLHSATTASLIFTGGEVHVYGTRSANGAAGMLVVDGQYLDAAHIDESAAAGPADECELLASFTGLNQLMMHNLTVVVSSPSVGEELTFVVASVTTDAVPSAAAQASRGDGRPPLAAIVVPTVAGTIVVIALLFLLSRWVTRRRDSRKAPSAAFRAEHPELASYSRGPPSKGSSVVSPSPSFFQREEKGLINIA